MQKRVYIHTNERQWLGALVAAHSLRRNSATPDAFAVEILHTRDFPYPHEREPWKTGLKVDYTPADKFKRRPALRWLNQLRARRLGEYALLGRYRRHPDIRQQQFFFGLLKECLDSGRITESLVRDEIRQGHIHADAMQVVARTPDLPR